MGLWAVEDKAMSWRSDYYLIVASLCAAALYLVLVPDMSDASEVSATRDAQRHDARRRVRRTTIKSMGPLTRQDNAAEEETALTDERQSSETPKKVPPGQIYEVCTSLLSPFVGLLVVAGCLGTASDNLMQAWAPAFFIALTDDPEAYAIENAIIIQLIAGVIGAVCGGLLADVWENKGLTSSGPNPAAMLQVPAIGLLVAGSSMYGLLYTKDYTTAFLCYCVFEPAQKTFFAPMFVAVQGASKPSLRDVILGVFMFLIWDSGAAMGSVIGEGALVRYSPRFPNPKKARTRVGSGCMATVCCPKRLHF